MHLKSAPFSVSFYALILEFLEKFPKSVDIQLFETETDFKKSSSQKTNPAYQKYVHFLIAENIVSFTEDEKDAEKQFIKEYKRYPLNIAARYGHTEIVKLLLSYKSNVNIREEYGNTPLISASQNNHLETVQELIKNKADINAKNEDDNTALFLAVSNNNIEVIKELLDSGANVEETSQGYTPLMRAANDGYLEATKLLLMHGARVDNITKNDGYSALQFAVSNKHKELAKLLITNGADVNLRDINGQTAIMRAVQTDDYNLVDILIKSGADVNAKTLESDIYVLDYAVAMYEEYHTDKKIINLLIDSGSKSNKLEIKQFEKKSTPTRVVNKPLSITDFKYTLTDDGNGVAIYKYNGNNPVVIIPNEIEGFPVTQIGQYDSIFNNKTIFEKVIVPGVIQ